MNDSRRKGAAAVLAALQSITGYDDLLSDLLEKINYAFDEFEEKLSELRSEGRDHLEAIALLRDDEQEAFDNMPEGLQSGAAGEASEAAIAALESAHESLDEFASYEIERPDLDIDMGVDSLEAAISSLEEVVSG